MILWENHRANTNGLSMTEWAEVHFVGGEKKSKLLLPYLLAI